MSDEHDYTELSTDERIGRVRQVLKGMEMQLLDARVEEIANNGNLPGQKETVANARQRQEAIIGGMARVRKMLSEMELEVPQEGGNTPEEVH